MHAGAATEESATGTGSADSIAAADKMPEEVLRIARGPRFSMFIVQWERLPADVRAAIADTVVRLHLDTMHGTCSCACASRIPFISVTMHSVSQESQGISQSTGCPLLHVCAHFTFPALQP